MTIHQFCNKLQPFQTNSRLGKFKMDKFILWSYYFNNLVSIVVKTAVLKVLRNLKILVSNYCNTYVLTRSPTFSKYKILHYVDLINTISSR